MDLASDIELFLQYCVLIHLVNFQHRPVWNPESACKELSHIMIKEEPRHGRRGDGNSHTRVSNTLLPELGGGVNLHEKLQKRSNTCNSDMHVAYATVAHRHMQASSSSQPW